MQNGGNATNDGAINRVRKPGVRLNGSIVSATLASRNNVFRDGDAGAGGVSIMGLTNAGVRLLAQASPNYWDLYQLGNGAPVPVVEGNAYFEWTPNGGFATHPPVLAVSGGQSIPASTAAIITGSLIAVPPQGFQIGTVIRWTYTISKTAAGVAARTHNIRVGTAGTAAGDASVAQISLTPTAVADIMTMVWTYTVIGPLGASCVGVPTLQVLGRLLATTGFATVATTTVMTTAAPSTVLITAAAFNSTTAQQFISCSITTGAAEVITVINSFAEVINPSNP